MAARWHRSSSIEEWLRPRPEKEGKRKSVHEDGAVQVVED